MSYDIWVEDTPNPQTKKFIVWCPVMGDKDMVFLSKGSERCRLYPLADRLLHIQGVEHILLGKDFISITKDAKADFENIIPVIQGTIIDHISNHFPIDLTDHGENLSDGKELDVLSKQIKDIIDQKVRPSVAEDGGDIVFDSFKDGIVFVHMHGACLGCASATATLKGGVENMLKHYVPEVLEVRMLNL